MSFLPRPRLAALTGASAMALCVATATADPAPPFDQLLKSAQHTAPRLSESRAEVGRSEGLARQAAARPNPTLGVTVENVSGSGPFKGAAQAETTFEVQQALELGGKRPARAAAGRADLDAARARAVQVRADFAFDLAAAYAAAEATDLRTQLAADAIVLAEDDARVATALVRAGKEADLRGLQARSAVQAARAALDVAKAERATAFARLSALAGAEAPITSIPASLLQHADRMEPVTAPDPLASPAYRSAQAARDAVARRLRVERVRATPDLTVSLGVRRLAGDGAAALVAGLSAPFPIFDRNGGAISAAQAELRAAEARLDGARLDAQAEIASAVSHAGAAQNRVAALRESERTASEAYRLSRIGYEGGKLPLLELINARRALTEARAQTLDARLERLGAESALARLDGRTPFGDQP
jgi:cobalt-zinc-cadmium efflux system outer membrane protein